MDNNKLFDDLDQNFNINDFLSNNSKDNQLFPDEEKESVDAGKEETTGSSEGATADEDPLKARFETVSKAQDIDIPDTKFYMAITENGREKFNSELNFRLALENPQNVGKRYFVFDNEGNNPTCIEVHKNGYSVAKNIGAYQQIGDETYVPMESLRLADVAEISTYENKTALEKRLGEAQAIKKNSDAYLQPFIDKVNEFKAKEAEISAKIKKELAEEKGKTPDTYAVKPKKPTNPAPKLSTGSKISRFFYKIITLGMGETNAYLKYKQALDVYHSQPYFQEKRVYDEEKKLFDDRFKKEYKNKLAELEKKFSDASERVEEIEYEIDDIKDKMNESAFETDARNAQVEEYHSNTEVIMEGIADIKREGRVTQDNIFANTWLHKKAIEGKNPSIYTSEDVDHLANYVVSEIAERKMLDNFLKSPGYAAGQTNSRILAGINNGSAVEQMKRNPVFTDLLDKVKAEKKVFNLKKFSHSIEMTMKEEINPLSRLKNSQKNLLESFGNKPITSECEDIVARYNYLSSVIKVYEDKFKSNKKWEKNDIISAKSVNSLVLDNAPISPEIKKNNPKETLANELKKVKNANHTAFERLCNNPKLKGKTFTLDNLVSMVKKEKANPTKQVEQGPALK